jgi:aminopeptidase N
MHPETQTTPAPVLRSSYAPPAWQVLTVDLSFELEPEATQVTARLSLERQGPDDVPLELDGEELTLESITVDGQALNAERYEHSSSGLVVHGLPARCVLETRVILAPEKNTALSGLYRSSGNYCTQCEAQGFRRITFFLDRPDVMARYTTEIVADAGACPVMLSNGNRVESEVLADGRHRVRWEDPFPKPSYLFALVAGQLVCHGGSFTTASGREVKLEIWVEAHDADKCEHALVSLQRSMRWDEQEFGREYDLDLYMIVAVGDFNMGAMENKGLNVFNSKFVLARPDTATDDDYEGVEAVIAHEYFHNWTGNRVTCRDWFQLTLKEGLTVYRDQRFSADMTSAAVKRIDDVLSLRGRQFAEDAGPMAHPVRPESYVAMDNFYTATVYDKGSEVVGMYATLLGKDGFRRGMDLYFERHDGQAVTCDDFRAAMADANGADLDQFERWYRQAGTPRLVASGVWDGAAGCYALTLEQRCPAGQTSFEPLHIPVRVGLIGPDGADLPLGLAGEAETPIERVLELREACQTFVFEGLEAEPVPSVLRGFSAPVILELERTPEQLAFLLANDGDPFNRWDAGQQLFAGAIFDLMGARAAGAQLEVPDVVVQAFRSVLLDPAIDGSMRALTLTLPMEGDLAQRMDVVDPDGLYAAREHLATTLASRLKAEFSQVYEALAPQGPYRAEKAEIDRRRTRNLVLAYLSRIREPETDALAAALFDSADNMTDSEAALGCLVGMDTPDRERALAEFHTRWKGEALVLDKWFKLQAECSLPGAPARARALMEHPDFSLQNPNRARSVVGVFSMANHHGFHDASGDGYALLADAVLVIDQRNPQLAARLVGSFNPWRRYDSARQELMRAQLMRIQACPSLSKNTGEIVGRALEG